MSKQKSKTTHHRAKFSVMTNTLVMPNTLLSCWEYSRNSKHVLLVTVFWQFDRLVDSKVGFNPLFHSTRGPLDIILVPAVSNKQRFQHTWSEAQLFSNVVCMLANQKQKGW